MKKIVFSLIAILSIAMLTGCIGGNNENDNVNQNNGGTIHENIANRYFEVNGVRITLGDTVQDLRNKGIELTQSQNILTEDFLISVMENEGRMWSREFLLIFNGQQVNMEVTIGWNRTGTGSPGEQWVVTGMKLGSTCTPEDEIGVKDEWGKPVEIKIETVGNITFRATQNDVIRVFGEPSKAEEDILFNRYFKFSYDNANDTNMNMHFNRWTPFIFCFNEDKLLAQITISASMYDLGYDL